MHLMFLSKAPEFGENLASLKKLENRITDRKTKQCQPVLTNGRIEGRFR